MTSVHRQRLRSCDRISHVDLADFPAVALAQECNAAVNFGERHADYRAFAPLPSVINPTKCVVHPFHQRAGDLDMIEAMSCDFRHSRIHAFHDAIPSRRILSAGTNVMDTTRNRQVKLSQIFRKSAAGMAGTVSAYGLAALT